MPEEPKKIEQWLPDAKAGSAAALGQVLEAARKYLLWVARRELDPDLQPKAGASDLVQDTLLEAHRDFGQFQGESEAELLSWLRRLLLNNLSNLARNYRQTAKRKLAREQHLDAGADESGLQIAGHTPTPSAQIMAGERDSLVRKAMDRLPEDYRKVLVLWQQEEMTFEQIGQQMGRTPNATRMLWVRALERLQRELEQLGSRK